jgi:hypothetical protein
LGLGGRTSFASVGNTIMERFALLLHPNSSEEVAGKLLGSGDIAARGGRVTNFSGKRPRSGELIS